MVNKVRALLKDSKDVVNGWVTIPAAFGAETMALAGWDSLTFDMQHGIMDYMTVVHCIQATQYHGTVPLVCVPWNEPGIIGRVLDAGAMGIICPMVSTKKDAQTLVKAARYPTLGMRSHGPIRAGTYGEAGTYYKTANNDILCFPMVETVEAIANLDAILDVEGIDGVYLGPADLGLTMGLSPTLDRDEPEILAHYETVVRKTTARGLAAGIHNATAEYAIRMRRMGFLFNSILTDSGLLLRSAKAEVEKCRTVPLA